MYLARQSMPLEHGPQVEAFVTRGPESLVHPAWLIEAISAAKILGQLDNGVVRYLIKDSNGSWNIVEYGDVIVRREDGVIVSMRVVEFNSAYRKAA